MRQACTQALRWLARREYCREQLLQRLLREKRVPQEVARQALDWLEAQGMLDEARYAESVMRSRLRRGYTPRMAARWLREAGVQEAVMQRELATREASFDEEEACRALLRKRDPDMRRKRDPRARARFIRFLCSRGFSLSLARKLVEEDAMDDEGMDCPALRERRWE